MKRSEVGSRLRIFSSKTVVEAAHERVEWLFHEFDNVLVCVSGGKDSTVILDVALEVATQLKRLPLKVYWLDQEAEWQSTVDIVREWMYRDDVEPIWLQVPFRIFNASSQTDHWLYAWDPAARDRWVHDQDPISFKENVYGTDRFAKLYDAAVRHHFDGKRACSIAGVRTEESPNRRTGLTGQASYKWVTWGNHQGPDRWAFYPLYDWTYRDVWRYIFERELAYSPRYDLLYQDGCPVREMRVSNLHHETAVRSLFQLQEFEPETYERLAARIGGIDMAGKFGEADFFPTELPFMFTDWREYRDYLLRHLVEDDYRPSLAKLFNDLDRRLPGDMLEQSYRMEVRSIMTCDWEGVKIGNWRQSARVYPKIKANRENWKTRDELPVPA